MAAPAGPDESAPAGRRSAVRRFGVLTTRRQTEIQDLDTAVPGREEVLRLQVSVNDSLLVRRRETFRDPAGPIDRRAERHGPRREAGPQCLPLEQFRDDVRNGSLAAEVVDLEYGWVGKRRDSLGLSFEASDSCVSGGRFGRQHLDGDLAVEPRVPRPVHFSHPPGAERRQDLIGTQTSSGRQAQRCETLQRRSGRARRWRRSPGRQRPSPALQFTTIVVGVMDSRPIGATMRKRLPSDVATYLLRMVPV